MACGLMLMRSVVIASVLLAGVAHADDAIELHEQTLFEKSNEPMLHIDPVFRPGMTGLGTREDTHERTMMQVGGSFLELEGVHWTNEDKDGRMLNDNPTPERGWTVGARLSRDFGSFEASLLARLGEIDSQESLLSSRIDGDQSRFEPARYYEIGLTIGKSKKLSRWMTAWVALTLGYRGYIGEPPGAEKNGGQAMLSVGTTFE